MTLLDNPQNPYGSYVVSASAGCGKTYQLARRFLYLVAGGADPQGILTITFTKKAAQEMRERILQGAAALLRSKDEARAFDETIGAMQDEAAPLAQAQFGYRLLPPRSAEVTARAVLAGTQLLKITTIDSVFLDWVRKFLWEASEERDGGRQPFPADFAMAGAEGTRLVNDLAWRQTVKGAFKESPSTLWEKLDVKSVSNRLFKLAEHRSLCWYTSTLRDIAGHNPSALNCYPLRSESLERGAVMKRIKTPLLRILDEISNGRVREECSAALEQSDPDLLLASPLITREQISVSGTYVRGAKREKLAAEIAIVEGELEAFYNERCLAALNDEAKQLMELYHDFDRHRETLKRRQKLMEFDDTGKGCFRLFTGEEAGGARFLIHKQIQHLMLDEFQDTSLLQWSIFHAICQEMLSGMGLEARREGLRPSIFIVGDEKQSIYGFREADPAILGAAANTLAEQGVRKVPLNRSYRTAQVVLDLANIMFTPRLDGFARHETATLPSGEPVVVDYGEITVAPDFSNRDEPRREEARYVAAFIKERLTGEKPYLIFDKKSRRFRPMELADVAILYRVSTHAHLFEEALQDVGLAARRDDGNGFMERQEVQDAMALLQFAAFPNDILSLISFLKSPLASIGDDLLLPALTATRELSGVSRTAKILEFCRPSHPEVVSVLEWAMAAAYEVTPHELLATVWGDLDCRTAYCRYWPPVDAAQALANLDKFMELVVVTATGEAAYLPVLLKHLKSLDEPMGNAPVTAAAITLMTIHKAKGLEFPFVVVVDTNSLWEKTEKEHYWVKGEDPKAGQGLFYVGTSAARPTKNHPYFQERMAAIRDEAKAESLRLLYVALTRASQYLLITAGAAAKAGDETFYPAIKDALIANPHEESEDCGERVWRWRRMPPLADKEGVSTSTPPLSNPAITLDAWTAPGVLPEAVKILAPSRLLSRDDNEAVATKSVDGVRERFASAIGTYIHKGLELAVAPERGGLEELWQRLVGAAGKEGQAEALAVANTELQAVLSSPSWQELSGEAASMTAEMDIVHLSHGELVRGTIDLVVERRDGSYLIVDYKTTALMDENFNDGLLRQFTVQKGYDQQLRVYREALKAIYPGARVDTAVYFTTLQRLLFLSKE